MHLVVIAGPDKGTTFLLTVGDHVRLGRSQSTLTRLNDPQVSRIHCELDVEEGRVTLTDSDSAGGTFVNGERVAQQVLRQGDVIKVGGTQLRFLLFDVGTTTLDTNPATEPRAAEPPP
jgi:pSer/pThr/pTyr-binding forkhead associated (FHA) protein